MKWENLGLLYKPESNYDWMTSHASLPTALQINQHSFRIFYSTRDFYGKSHTTFVDLNFKKWEPGLLLENNNKQPSFSPNTLGYFDDSGVQVTSFIKVGEILYAYYLGWTRKIDVPFSAEIGIAIVDNKFNFKRIQKLPIYKKSEIEPFTFGYPTIFKRNKKLFMYYDSIDKFDCNNLNNYKFDLRCAEIKNGNWVYCDKILLENNNKTKPKAKAFTRPAFISTRNRTTMIYSYNINGNYKLKAAYQDHNDQHKWIIDKNFLFKTSGQDWDSEAQVFCNIFNYDNDYYMLYNGNNYGKTGFGIAKLTYK
jgi:hypothetical protein